jgi:hypothetical protein
MDPMAQRAACTTGAARGALDRRPAWIPTSVPAKLKASVRGLSMALVWALAAAPVQANPALDAGRAAFTGQSPLVAMMPGHREALPPAAARCSNCHAAPGLPAAGNGALGPGLSAATLMRALPRRGGPPSRYDAEALCRALREGVDPAGVMLGSAMPRYRIDDLGCRQLWTLLTSDLR